MNSQTRGLKLSNWPAYLTNNTGWAITFFVIGVISRLPFRSQWLYHWDSVNFALGMEHFDVRLHQPHPPGYLLYVLLGQLVNGLMGDANASLVWISVLFGGLTVSVVYWLGLRLFGRTEAIISALFALTGPAFWFYGEVALTYIVEAFFVTVIALTCLETLDGNSAGRPGHWRVALLSALLLGVAGGIRQTTLVLMLPLWLFSLRRCPWRISIPAIFLLALTVISWLAPTILLSGGLASYLEASRSIGGGVLSNFELFNSSFGQALLGPFVRFSMYLVYGLMLALIPLIYGIIKGIVRAKTWLRQWLLDDRAHVLALWLIPNLIFYAPLVRVPGHTFSFMPALALLAAAALVMFSRDLSGWLSRHLSWLSESSTRLTLGLTGLILIANITFFLAAPPYLLGIQRVITTTPSWSTIYYRDRYLAERVTAIKQRFDSATTVILTNSLDYRHPDYYLRDYDTLNYESALMMSNIPVSSQTMVFFSNNFISHQDGLQAILLPSGESLFYLPLDPNSEIIIDQSEVSVQLMTNDQ